VRSRRCRAWFALLRPAAETPRVVQRKSEVRKVFCFFLSKKKTLPCKSSRAPTRGDGGLSCAGGLLAGCVVGRRGQRRRTGPGLHRVACSRCAHRGWDRWSGNARGAARRTPGRGGGGSGGNACIRRAGRRRPARDTPPAPGSSAAPGHAIGSGNRFGRDWRFGGTHGFCSSRSPSGARRGATIWAPGGVGE